MRCFVFALLAGSGFATSCSVFNSTSGCPVLSVNYYYEEYSNLPAGIFDDIDTQTRCLYSKFDYVENSEEEEKTNFTELRCCITTSSESETCSVEQMRGGPCNDVLKCDQFSSCLQPPLMQACNGGSDCICGPSLNPPPPPLPPGTGQVGCFGANVGDLCSNGKPCAYLQDDLTATNWEPTCCAHNASLDNDNGILRCTDQGRLQPCHGFYNCGDVFECTSSTLEATPFQDLFIYKSESDCDGGFGDCVCRSLEDFFVYMGPSAPPPAAEESSTFFVVLLVIVVVVVAILVVGARVLGGGSD